MIRGFGKVDTGRHSVPTSPFVHLRKSRHWSALSADLGPHSADLKTKSALIKDLIALKTVPTSADLPNIYPLTRAREKSLGRPGTSRHWSTLAGQR